MKAFVLAYHSHRVLGTTYETNDHTAFAQDLLTIAKSRCEIVLLPRLVAAIGRESGVRKWFKGRRRYVALTFDDGPEFDAVDFEHPDFGPQRSFLGAMQDFCATPLGRDQREIGATSFVIASPAARAVMETAFDPRFTYLSRGCLNEDWWNPAIDSSLISIANHSWDHLHPGLPKVAHSRQAKADFRAVDNERDADAQIADAFQYILRKTQGRAAPFLAYPYGHYNEFLTNDYLPNRTARHCMRAAFSTDGRAVDSASNPWCIPRFTCGDHWKHADELALILESDPGSP